MINIKTYVKIIVVSTFIGGLLAILFYTNITREVKAITNKENIVYLFQVGVFKSLDNASIKAMDYENAIIYNDAEYYRVIIGVASNTTVLEKLKTEFDQENINYYIKELRVTVDTYNELEEFATVIVKTNNSEVISKLNKSMLDKLNSYLN